MVFLWGAVPHAVFGKAVPAIRAGEVSAAGEAVSTMVREEWLCTGRVPAQSFGARGTDPPDVWFSIAAVGGKEAHNAVRAVAVGLGCSGGGTTAGTNAVVRDRIGGQEGAQPRNGCAMKSALRGDDTGLLALEL